MSAKSMFCYSYGLFMLRIEELTKFWSKWTIYMSKSDKIWFFSIFCQPCVLECWHSVYGQFPLVNRPEQAETGVYCWHTNLKGGIGWFIGSDGMWQGSQVCFPKIAMSAQSVLRYSYGLFMLKIEELVKFWSKWTTYMSKSDKISFWSIFACHVYWGGYFRFMASFH